MKPRTWRTWHLVGLFAVGSVVMWCGEQIKDWAGKRIKKAWFGDDDGDES